ncbi:hypothetical protein [Clostridium polynesiense]|uniref:hypothetical protein n=1 Tax=Clostridium polynesiense TaxID=1325933 RepID=UPI0005902CB2|nr:hypothetical protein [Clostridium polynesiense]
MKKRYKQEELNRALDMLEEGYTYSEVLKEIQLNKSILAREMRKRKNVKARKNIEDYRISLLK